MNNSSNLTALKFYYSSDNYETISLLLLLGFAMVCVLSNALYLLIFLLHPLLKNRQKQMLMIVAGSDLVNGVTSLMVTCLGLKGLHLVETAANCLWKAALLTFGINLSQMSLLGLAIDRFVATVAPKCYSEMTKTKTWATFGFCVFMLLFSVVSTGMSFYNFQFAEDIVLGSVCPGTLIWSPGYRCYIIILCISHALVLVIVYCVMLVLLKMKMCKLLADLSGRKQMDANAVAHAFGNKKIKPYIENPPNATRNGTWEEKYFKKEEETTRIATIMMCAYVILWVLPNLLNYLINRFGPTGDISTFLSVLSSSVIPLANILNSCLNLYVYLWQSSYFRRVLCPVVVITFKNHNYYWGKQGGAKNGLDGAALSL